MMASKSGYAPDDEINALELKISVFLRWGVLLAGALLLLGWMINLLFPLDPVSVSTNPLQTFHTYQKLPLDESFERAFAAQDASLLISYAGLGVLISLPILRVFLTTFLFLKRREYWLASIAGLVVVLLAASVLLGWEI